MGLLGLQPKLPVVSLFSAFHYSTARRDNEVRLFFWIGIKNKAGRLKGFRRPALFFQTAPLTLRRRCSFGRRLGKLLLGQQIGLAEFGLGLGFKHFAVELERVAGQIEQGVDIAAFHINIAIGLHAVDGALHHQAQGVVDVFHAGAAGSGGQTYRT